MISKIQRAREIYDRWNESSKGFTENYLMELSELTDDETGEVEYIMGVLTYHEARVNDDDISSALIHFDNAISQNKNHYMAYLYAGYCCHDLGDHLRALELYESVNVEKLKDEYPIWRYVKLIEQMGECYHKIGLKDNAYSLFTEVAGYYDNVSFDELADPLELFRCLDPDDPLVIKLKGKSDNYYK